MRNSGRGAMDGRTGPAGKPGMAVDRSAHWHLGYGFPGGTSGISTAHAQGRPGDSASSQGVRRQEVCRCRLNRNVARQTTVFPWFYLTAIVLGGYALIRDGQSLSGIYRQLTAFRNKSE